MNIKGARLGIIGGKGKMGSFIKKTLEKDVEILVSDQGTKLTNVDLVKECTIIVISVPIRKTVSVIEEIAPHLTKDHLLLDVCSLKQKSCEAMGKTKAEAIGVHPMFAPSAKDMNHQTIVLCPVTKTKMLECIKAMFEKKGANVVVSTPEHHDKMMGVVQCLTHFISISYILAMKNLGITLGELVDYASPVYLIELLMSGRILAQDKSLYTDIQLQNPASKEILEGFLKGASQLKDLVAASNTNEFEKCFEGLSDYLGSFKDTAKSVSEKLLDTVKESKEELLRSC